MHVPKSLLAAQERQALQLKNARQLPQDHTIVKPIAIACESRAGELSNSATSISTMYLRYFCPVKISLDHTKEQTMHKRPTAIVQKGSSLLLAGRHKENLQEHSEQHPQPTSLAQRAIGALQPGRWRVPGKDAEQQWAAQGQQSKHPRTIQSHSSNQCPDVEHSKFACKRLHDTLSCLLCSVWKAGMLCKVGCNFLILWSYHIG